MARGSWAAWLSSAVLGAGSRPRSAGTDASPPPPPPDAAAPPRHDASVPPPPASPGRQLRAEERQGRARAVARVGAPPATPWGVGAVLASLRRRGWLAPRDDDGPRARPLRLELVEPGHDLSDA